MNTKLKLNHDVSVRFDAETKKQLKETAKSLNLSLSNFCRCAIITIHKQIIDPDTEIMLIPQKNTFILDKKGVRT